MPGVATYIEEAIDKLLMNFVTVKSAAFCGVLAPLALTGTTIYVMILGYAVMRGEAHDSLHTVLWKWFKVSMVAGIALSGGEYQATVVEAINAIPGIMSDVFGGAGSIGGMIDGIADPLIKLVKMLQTKSSMGTFPDLTLFAASLAVGLAQLIIVVIGIAMYVFAKVGLALCLAVGPIFVLCLLWPATQSRFEGWLGQTLSFAWLQGMLGAAIGMLYTLIEQFADKVQANAKTNDVLTDAGALLAVTVVIAILVWRMPQIAAAMTGGTSVEGLGKDVGRWMANAFNGSGKSSQSRGGGGGEVKGGNSRQPAQPATPSSATANARSSYGTDTPLYQRQVIDNIRRAAS